MTRTDLGKVVMPNHYIGKKIGGLTLIKKSAVRMKNGRRPWLCKCDCGNYKRLSSAALNGGTKSCGCLQRSHNYRDLTGQQFGRLKVIREDGRNRRNQVRWLTECECGKITRKESSNLIQGLSKSCGCPERRQMSGKRFGRLTVIEPVDSDRGYDNKWYCKCDCGKMVERNAIHLRKSKNQSCGCYIKELCSARALPEGEASLNNLYGEYLLKAKKRNYSFNLTKDQFRVLTKGNCFYCGVDPSRIKKSHKSFYIYNGIDRVDNSKGYEIDNCVSCCWPCNSLKGPLNANEFLARIKLIAGCIEDLERSNAISELLNHQIYESKQG